MLYYITSIPSGPNLRDLRFEHDHKVGISNEETFNYSKLKTKAVLNTVFSTM